MTKIEFLLVVVLVALASSSEVEDGELKKRGAGKTTSLNAIPTGAQKPEYTYNIYSQNPGSQSQSVYQSQIPNSFYPTQNSQYYTSQNIQADQGSYPQQPQINLIPPTQSQFLPLNFLQNSGYQAKYQIVPSKSANGNIQLAILQQPSNFQSPILQFPQQYLSASPSNQFQQHSPLLSSVPQGNFNLANYQSLPLGNSYLGQQSPIMLVSQPNPYNNLVYPNPLQNVYNYYPSNSQGKYASYPTSSPQTAEYEKIQTPSQSISKEDNDINHTEYVSASDSNYKNAYTSGRSSYTKL